MRAMAFGLALLSITFLGCGGNMGGVGPGMEEQESVFKEAVDLLRCGNGKHAKLADLAGFEANFPKAYQSVKSGDIVVNWGVGMLGEGESANPPKDIIAYEKAAKESGGWVVYTNGIVKKIAAGGFPK